jgi:hypothetical protein
MTTWASRCSTDPYTRLCGRGLCCQLPVTGVVRLCVLLSFRSAWVTVRGHEPIQSRMFPRERTEHETDCCMPPLATPSCNEHCTSSVRCCHAAVAPRPRTLSLGSRWCLTTAELCQKSGTHCH